MKLRPEAQIPELSEALSKPMEDLKALAEKMPGRVKAEISVNELNDDWYRIAAEYGVPVGYIKEIAILFLDGRMRKTVKMLIARKVTEVKKIEGYDYQAELRLYAHSTILIRIIFETIQCHPQLYFKTYRRPVERRRKAEYDY